MRTGYKWVIYSLLVLIVFCFGVFAFLKYAPNEKELKFNENFDLMIFNGVEDISDDYNVKINEGEVSVEFEFVKEFIDPDMIFAKDTKKIIITTRDKVIRLEDDNVTAMINERPVDLQIAVRVENDKAYIPVELLEKLYNFKLSYIPQYNVVLFDEENAAKRVAVIIDEKAHLRWENSRRSYKIEKIFEIDEEVQVYEEYEKYYKVRTKEGIVGFIEKRFVKVRTEFVKYESPSYFPYRNWEPIEGKINMVWEYIGNVDANQNRVKDIDGLDVISPAWFDLSDERGNFISKADVSYTKDAREKGYVVWGMATNSMDPELTSKCLNSEVVRRNMINQLLTYAAIYELDGINIDFENMYLEDKDMLTQFIRELYPLTKKAGLVLSVDIATIGPSDNWSRIYDRPALNDTVDYLCLMTYDQHYAASPISGSVAQYSWVERELKEVLEQVDNKKLLLGLNFYTRLWTEVENEDGEVTNSSSVYFMDRSQKFVKDNELIPVWDEESGQYYAEMYEEDKRLRLWIEDVNSINLKSSLVHKYELAGTCAWEYGFETSDIWPVLKTNLKDVDNYETWARTYGYEDRILE